MTSNVEVRELIVDEAAEWFVANRGGLASKERQAFVAWLQTSPVHVEEYLAHSSVARDLRRACQYSAANLAELVARTRTRPDPIVPSSWAQLRTGLARRGINAWRAGGIIATGAVAALSWVMHRLRVSRDPK